MSAIADPDVAVVPDSIPPIVAGIAERGYAVAAGALPDATVAALRTRARALDAAGALAPAHVGRGASRDLRADVRGDRIRWLDPGAADPAEAEPLAFLDALRVACNRALMAGLAEFEGHYALYPPGARYARHRDRFRDDDARVLSCVLYLNERWQPADGGALRVYVDRATTIDVTPTGGTLVAFLSDAFEHEVLPATRPRIALTGWFRRRPLARGTRGGAC
ncbi:MAG: 2OG-Fe(II) oxygenase [Burkholderiales bacterium]